MGSNPSEYDGVNCGICGRGLPPCKNWSGFTLQTIDRLDQVYVFLGGQYYRVQGLPSYYCPTDFWDPKRKFEKEKEEKNSREEKERRQKEEEERWVEEELRKEAELQEEFQQHLENQQAMHDRRQ